jgi:two-component system, cell cycle response regulator
MALNASRRLTIRNRRKSDYAPTEIDGRPRALAVDDDPSYLRLLSRLLGEIGFDVTIAEGGAEALALLADEDFELVLLDLKMPGLDGFETFDQMKARRDKPYCILLTASDSLDIRVEAFNRGFDDFVSKGANPLEMAAKLNAARRIVSIQRKLKDENDELMQLAMTDQLTGLSNRFYLFSKARELSATAKTIHVILFDLDHFKEVNDRYGHLTGDRILADVAGAMRHTLRDHDVLSRFGGDEFVLLLIDIDEKEAHSVAERIAGRVAALNWTLGGAEVRLSISYGIATSEGRSRSLPELLSECDERLYGKKKRTDNPMPEDAEPFLRPPDLVL